MSDPVERERTCMDDVMDAVRLIRESRPTILVAPSDLDRIREAAKDRFVNVDASPYVEAGHAIFIPSMRSVWGQL